MWCGNGVKVVRHGGFAQAISFAQAAGASLDVWPFPQHEPLGLCLSLRVRHRLFLLSITIMPWASPSSPRWSFLVFSSPSSVDSCTLDFVQFSQYSLHNILICKFVSLEATPVLIGDKKSKQESPRPKLTLLCADGNYIE